MNKNLNKARENHTVGRVIHFKNWQEAARFVDIYKDLFFKPTDKCDSRHENGFLVSDNENPCNDGTWTVWFTTTTSNWNKICEAIPLEKSGQRRHYNYID